jgi:Tfp pilus assembly protein PilN
MKLDLNDIKKRLMTRSALAVTIESGRVVAKVVRGEGEQTQTAALTIPVGGEEILKDPDKAGQQFATALSGAGIRERECVVCVPAGWALTASTDLPEVGAEDLRGYLELRAEREFSISATDLRLGYCAYSLPSGQRRATLAALSSKKIEAVERMLAVANRRATSISLALDKCLTSPKPMLHFLTNGNHTDLVVTAGGGIAGLRSLAGPLAPGDTTFDPVSFCRDVRITLGRLPDGVRQQIRDAEFSGPSAESLCVQTRFDLLRMGIQSPESSAAAEAARGTSGAAAEAARLKLSGQPIAFEFVVPETKRWQVLLERFDSRRRRMLVLGAVALVLLPLVAMFIRAQIESHLDAEWAAMESKANELDALQKRIHLFQPWYEPVPQELQLMNSLATAFPEQGDVWAKSIQVAEGDKVTCTGFARSQPALLAFLARLRARPDVSGIQVQQIRGQNPIQFSITYQWEQQHD